MLLLRARSAMIFLLKLQLQSKPILLSQTLGEGSNFRSVSDGPFDPNSPLVCYRVTISLLDESN